MHFSTTLQILKGSFPTRLYRFPHDILSSHHLMLLLKLMTLFSLQLSSCFPHPTNPPSPRFEQPNFSNHRPLGFSLKPFFSRATITLPSSVTCLPSFQPIPAVVNWIMGLALQAGVCVEMVISATCPRPFPSRGVPNTV